MDIEENVVMESEACAATSKGKPASDDDSDDEWPIIKKHVVAMKRVTKPKEADSDFVVLKAAFPECVVTSTTSSLRSKRVTRHVAPVTVEEVEEEEEDDDDDYENDDDEDVEEELGYKCQQCDKVVKTKKELDYHMKAHVRYKCCICEQLFSSMYTLTQHALKHDDNWRLKSYICYMCAKAFPNRAGLAAHEAIHSKPPGKRRRRRTERTISYRCDHCGREYNTISMLERHMYNHSTDKPYTCSLCPKAFKSPYLLKNHGETHVRKQTGAKPYKCDLCLKSFGLLGSLKAHIRRHSRGPLNKCSICKQVFAAALDLEQHMWTHAAEKQFVCVECFPSKRFAAATGLARHWKLMHASVVPKDWATNMQTPA